AHRAALPGVGDPFGGADHLPAVRRPGRVVAEVADAAHRLAGGSHDEEAAPLALGAEDDRRAVRGESRLRVRAGKIGREVLYGLAGDAPPVDVGAALLLDGVDEALGVRREA